MENKTSETKMFKNPVLEALSTSGPKTMIPFHLGLISLLIYYGLQSGYAAGNSLKLSVIFLAGFAFWTLAEYLLHRYVFHFVKENKTIQKIHYAVHGYHHSVPRDRKRLFMPPVAVVILISAFWLLFYLFMGKAVWFFLPGFELGYLLYAMMHYSIHTVRASQVPEFLKPLWIHHSLHHHQYPEKAFGVSNRFWDRVFGTMPPVK